VSDDLYEVMRCAPSTRRFTDEPVSREVLERVFDNARFAPSGGNRQGWRVIVVTDADKRRRMRELYEQPWDEYMIGNGGRAALDAVPVHLVVCVELDALAVTDAKLDRQSIVGGASVYPFVHNVLLGLRREGLGASFTTLLVPAEADVKELLGIPEGVALAGHISVGHRENDWPTKLSRNPVSDFVFAERFGEPWSS
jgi:nitroreductase